MKYGLALEGGGAKGAYQIGVVKALIENGYKFNVIVGTSIGALNAAMIVQDRLDDAIKLWSNISYSQMFNLDDKKVNNALTKKIDIEIVKYFSKKFSGAVKNGGISTENIRKIISDNVDEKLVRKSSIKFGLVTVNISDRKPEEKFIEDIKKGELVDYLLATSSLPVFKRATIDNKKYIDGGVYDNCPVEMLEKSGCKEIIAVRNYKRMRIRNYKEISKKADINLQMIEPYENLPGILRFDSKNTCMLLKLGYFDGIKFAKKLDGFRYYIKPLDEKTFFNMLGNYDIKELSKIVELLEIELPIYGNIRKLLFEQVLGVLVSKTLIKEANSYKDSVYAIVEYVAKKEDIDRLKIYNFKEFLGKVKEKVNLKNRALSKYDKAIYRFVKYLEYEE